MLIFLQLADCSHFALDVFIKRLHIVAKSEDAKSRSTAFSRCLLGNIKIFSLIWGCQTELLAAARVWLLSKKIPLTKGKIKLKLLMVLDILVSSKRTLAKLIFLPIPGPANFFFYTFSGIQ